MKSTTDFQQYAENIRSVRTRLSSLKLPADNKWMNSIGAFIQQTGSSMLSQLGTIDNTDPFANMIQQNNIENREATTTDLSAKLFVCCNLMLIGASRLRTAENRPRLVFLQAFDITGDGKDTFDVPTMERCLERINQNSAHAVQMASWCIRASEAGQKRLTEMMDAHNRHHRLGQYSDIAEHAGNAAGQSGGGTIDKADKTVGKAPNWSDAMDDISTEYWTNIQQGSDILVRCMSGCIGIIGNAELQTEFMERCNYWCNEIEQIAAKYPQDQAQTQAIGERGQLEVNEQTEVVGAAAGGIGGQTSGNKGQRKGNARTAEAMAAAE